MKFSIRDLLLVTVIVALAVGWWVDRSRLKRAIEMEEWLLPEPPGSWNEKIPIEVIDRLLKEGKIPL